jgi:hypothetical protein
VGRIQWKNTYRCRLRSFEEMEEILNCEEGMFLKSLHRNVMNLDVKLKENSDLITFYLWA